MNDDTDGKGKKMTANNTAENTAWKSKLDSEALHRASKLFDLPRRRGEADVGLAERLIALFQSDPEVAQHVICDECELRSPARGATCPFCGTGDKPEHVEEIPAAVVPFMNGSASAPVTFVPEEQTQVKVVRSKRPKAESPVIVTEGTMAPAEPDPFDVAVHELRVFRSGLQRGWWLLGRKLAEVEWSGVWKLRTTGAGTPTYKKFEDFCMKEVGFTGETVKNAIDISKRFSEEEVLSLGPSKLLLVLRAPTADGGAALLDKAKAGASLREMGADLKAQKEANAEENGPGRAPVRETGRSPGGGGTPREQTRITALWVLNKTYKADLLVKKGKEQVAAKKKDVEQKPSAILEMNGTTSLLITVMEKATDGTLVVTVKPIRTPIES